MRCGSHRLRLGLLGGLLLLCRHDGLPSASEVLASHPAASSPCRHTRPHTALPPTVRGCVAWPPTRPNEPGLQGRRRGAEPEPAPPFGRGAALAAQGTGACSYGAWRAVPTRRRRRVCTELREFGAVGGGVVWSAYGPFAFFFSFLFFGFFMLDSFLATYPPSGSARG